METFAPHALALLGTSEVLSVLSGDAMDVSGC